MLIDGNSLTYRAFFALPQDLATGSGQVTNAVFGFTSMLINLVRDHKPDGLVVAFDRPEPTFRHEKVETYKANRSAAPDILKQQMGLVREVLDALRLPQVELAGFEADDILATLAGQAAAEGLDVLIVTGDRDSFQLVDDPRVKVVYNKRGVSDYAVYDEAGIAERTGVTPDKYVQYAAMRGDNSDNLPGVPGVGEKTAAKLINQYGDIDGIYAHLDDLTPKLRENLAANEDQVRINTVVMELLRDVDLEASAADFMGIEPYDVEEVKKLFDFLEFKTFLPRLEEAFASGGTSTADLADLAVALDTPSEPSEALAALAAMADGVDPVAIAADLGPGSGGDGPATPGLTGLAVVGAAPPFDGPVPVLWLHHTLLADETVASALGALLSVQGRGVYAHDAKPLLRSLLSTGTDMPGSAARHVTCRLPAGPGRQLLSARCPVAPLQRVPDAGGIDATGGPTGSG